MATHSSILALRIPWTEEPGRLQSTGSKESDTTERLNCHHQLPINNDVMVSGELQSDSGIHIHVSILPPTPLPARPPDNIKQSSLCCTVGPCWLSCMTFYYICLMVGWFSVEQRHQGLFNQFPIVERTDHWKDWCWSWSSNTLATWCEELTHWKRSWCWERLKAKEEGLGRRWDG